MQSKASKKPTPTVVADDVHPHDAAGALVEDELEQAVGGEDAAAEALPVQRQALLGVHAHS